MTNRGAQALGGVQLAVGAVLVARPSLAPRVPSWVVRVLGGRGVLQGALTLADPGPATLALGALVDATHALTMVPFVLASQRYRRPAAVSACIASALALAGAGLARTENPSAASR